MIEQQLDNVAPDDQIAAVFRETLDDANVIKDLRQRRCMRVSFGLYLGHLE
jgi:hypothetical protein